MGVTSQYLMTYFVCYCLLFEGRGINAKYVSSGISDVLKAYDG